VREDAPLVTPPAPASAGAGPAKVRVGSFAYLPGVVRIRRGQTVRWVNDDPAAHTITAKDGAWSSKMLAKGSTFSRRFTRPGTYVYVCAMHPSMRATVIVSR